MDERYILAHDTGTSGDKAVLTDLRGQVIESAYQPYNLHYPRPDWVEQDPDELWTAVANTTRLVLEKARIDPEAILGVGISAQMFNLLPVDERCQPRTPMLSWLDVRSLAWHVGVLCSIRTIKSGQSRSVKGSASQSSCCHQLTRARR